MMLAKREGRDGLIWHRGGGFDQPEYWVLVWKKGSGKEQIKVNGAGGGEEP